ncbi:MAG: amidase family protein, partial [Bacilli bacterium]
MNKPISELHQMLVDKKIKPIDLVEDCISGIENDSCNCFEAKAFDESRKEALKIKEVKPDEYLKGIPYLVKDNYSTKGVETTASSNILNGYVP